MDCKRTRARKKPLTGLSNSGTTFRTDRQTNPRPSLGAPVVKLVHTLAFSPGVGADQDRIWVILALS
jgi:hypothetical protein